MEVMHKLAMRHNPIPVMHLIMELRMGAPAPLPLHLYATLPNYGLSMISIMQEMYSIQGR